MVKLNPDKKVVEAVKEGLKRRADIAPAAANGRKITSASVANSANRSPIPNSKALPLYVVLQIKRLGLHRLYAEIYARLQRACIIFVKKPVAV